MPRAARGWALGLSQKYSGSFSSPGTGEKVNHGILRASPKAGMEIRECELFLEERKQMPHAPLKAAHQEPLKNGLTSTNKLNPSE